jgi:hypothetical protein
MVWKDCLISDQAVFTVNVSTMNRLLHPFELRSVVPANARSAYLSSQGNAWYCNRGYRSERHACVAVTIPAGQEGVCTVEKTTR